MISIVFDKGTADASIAGLQKGMNREVHSALLQIVTASVLDVQTTAKRAEYAPYKTGTLRRSITNEVVDLKDAVVGFVGSNLVYARIHEYGGLTGRNKKTKIVGKQYLSRAVAANANKVRQRFIAMTRIIK